MTRQRKKTFFEKLTGALNVSDDTELYDDDDDEYASDGEQDTPQQTESGEWLEEEANEGQLGVDVFETPNDIIVKAMVAGVRPNDLDISITRDMVILKGHREESHTVDDGNYFHRELYWGSFSRSVVLPAEVDVDAAEAMERHGLLILKLPKVDKGRQTKLKVKSE